jgi:trans-aconitate methyltransferase
MTGSGAISVKWNPDDYARHSTGQLVWARGLIERLRLRGDEAVLDVGCGDGRATSEVASAVPRGYVLGVDSSPEAITYARERYPSSLFPNLEFRVMDARHLAAERRFDAILSNATLHWVDDHPAFLAGCARLLKRDGRLVISCGGAGNGAEVFATAERLIQAPAWRSCFGGFRFPYHFYSTEDYRRWLPEAGLAPTRLELVERDMAHDGAAGMAGWVRTTWMPYTNRVPEARREAFVEKIVRTYLEGHPVDSAGRIHVRMVRLEVEAVTLQSGLTSGLASAAKEAVR